MGELNISIALGKLLQEMLTCNEPARVELIIKKIDVLKEFWDVPPFTVSEGD